MADSSLERQEGPDHANFVPSFEESGLDLNGNESYLRVLIREVKQTNIIKFPATK